MMGTLFISGLLTTLSALFSVFFGLTLFAVIGIAWLWKRGQ